MENKLQELTKKLYDEGLSKGRKDADTLLSDAHATAKKIISGAEADAVRIKKQAEHSAEDLRKNTLTELNLAGKQVIDKLKSSVREMIVTKATKESVTKANLDPEFVKEVLVSVAKNWNGASTDKVTLEAILPADKKSDLGEKTKQCVQAALSEGVEITYCDEVKSGFHIGPKDGGYYISFTDDGFDALLTEYLRPKVSEMLYGTKQ